jgi:superfamily I DNA and/or RNA helicase
MARKELKKLNKTRLKFTGKFERYGIKINYHGFSEKTILLKDITLNGKIVADHLWFNYTKGFQKLGELTKGDIIQFYARSKKYEKGYVNYRKYINEKTIDYKLNYPTQIEKIESLHINIQKNINSEIFKEI